MNNCSISNCGRRARAFGFCLTHYKRSRKGTDLYAPIRVYRPRPCEIDECGRPASCFGLCRTHYERKRTGRVIEAPIKPKDGRGYQANDGYIHIYVRGQRISQHRDVMQKVLGRELSEDESVHHKNGNRADNRPENLELWSRYQPSGQRVTDKLAWAYEIIKRYGLRAAA